MKERSVIKKILSRVQGSLGILQTSLYTKGKECAARFAAHPLSYVSRHTLLKIRFYKLILKLLKLFHTSIDFFNSEPVKLASIGV